MHKIKITLYIFLVLFVNACSNSEKNGETIPVLSNVDFSNTYVYDYFSPYRNNLKKCISVREKEKSCTLETLPFLSENERIPTKDQIMKRVLVSHKWMGERFEKMLDLFDEDMRILLGAVTAIVIDDDLKPSFYWSVTGAIYIDPKYLWQTPEEKRTITGENDYRDNYPYELQFLRGERFVRNGRLAFRIDEEEYRRDQDVLYGLSRILYHELSHANDFFPINERDNIDKSLSVYEVLDSLRNERISTKLNETYPLESEELKQISRVIWNGETATEEQKNMTAFEVGELFENDSAIELYGYSTIREDLATIFTNSMMKYHYDIEHEVAFLDRPDIEDPTCKDYKISWGKGNRLADENVREKALYIIDNLLPNISEEFKNRIGERRSLDVGKSWCILYAL